MTVSNDLETVEDFRARARTWLSENLPPAPPPTGRAGADDQIWIRARELQKIIHAGGFAGICFPREYGGLGLTIEYQRAFNLEAAAYEMPIVLNIPTFSICAATLLDAGSEEQKRTYLPRILAGEDVWAQFLSEPKGGSDLAGVITRSERTEGGWLINGSKIWSTAAYAADYGLCLTRSNWDVPKHSGLTMFIMPTNAPGVTISRIQLVNGSTEFCEAFFDNVLLPDDAVVGEVDGGWNTASQQLFHERNSMGGGSPHISGPRFRAGSKGPDLVAIARETGQLDNPVVRDRLAQLRVMDVVSEQIVRRIGPRIGSGALPPQAGSVIRLFEAMRSWEQYDIGLEVGGAAAVAGRSADDPGIGLVGQTYLSRQASSLGGGSSEMARNVISERVLGMPREHAPDRGVAFSQVKHGQT